MWRLRAEWSGTPVVGPGLSTFYALDTSPGFPAAVRAFLINYAPLLPSGTSIRVPNGGDVLDPATGELTGSWTDGSPPALVNGVGGGVFAQGVGLQVRWRTSGITAGRRVQGSTFIVPIISASYDVDGTLSGANVTMSTNAANAYVTAAPFAVIWSRPTDARAGHTSLITGGFTPDRVSWLRSRRR